MMAANIMEKWPSNMGRIVVGTPFIVVMRAKNNRTFKPLFEIAQCLLTIFVKMKVDQLQM
jgi:hypothetical protein